ncbi:hypothetical protein A3L12_03190 [Thermococcus sp. P6]|uniref:DUF2101 family protein n=1 Tax=Thermococcus sp. P6 TaxID=122420 RepID=UPI000B59CDB9|nr:DUF2101 family protein [Thermococcus sp. P6]ASJ10373.1 hypothetical protein A3L12_03190 [Thermococcus sp. P6]
MDVEEFLYRVGELVESGIDRLRDFFMPSPSERPPDFRYLRRLFKKPLTVHEYLSLRLQMAFTGYLILNFILLLIRADPLWLVGLAVVYFPFLRYTLIKNRNFFVEYEPYRFFYYGISAILLGVFLGYALIRGKAPEAYYYYAYLLFVLVVVLVFRWYFKSKYGRDYTYGIVEEIKGDLVRIFVHDDMAANVKPGHYWVDAVGDLEVGRVVKLLVEDRTFRGAVPVRIIEVYLTDQSSQSSTEPKKETE